MLYYTAHQVRAREPLEINERVIFTFNVKLVNYRQTQQNFCKSLKQVFDDVYEIC